MNSWGGCTTSPHQLCPTNSVQVRFRIWVTVRNWLKLQFWPKVRSKSGLKFGLVFRNNNKFGQSMNSNYFPFVQRPILFVSDRPQTREGEAKTVWVEGLWTFRAVFGLIWLISSVWPLSAILATFGHFWAFCHFGQFGYFYPIYKQTLAVCRNLGQCQAAFRNLRQLQQSNHFSGPSSSFPRHAQHLQPFLWGLFSSYQFFLAFFFL